MWAIGINPNNYTAYHHLGRVFINEGKLDQAMAIYKECIETLPIPMLIMAWASLYARRERFREAVANLKTPSSSIPPRPVSTATWRRPTARSGTYLRPRSVMEQVK
jgi:tetratricopeptide (TPR) repeat protein